MNIDQAMQLVYQHYQGGRFAEAQAACESILAVQPRHADALHVLGILAAQSHRLDAAADLISRAIAIDPRVPSYHNSLANILCDRGQRDQAIPHYQKAIALKPDYAEAHCNLANVLRHQGLVEDAIAACRRAISLNPNLPEAHTILGNSLRDQGQIDEAIVSLRRAVDLSPKHAIAHSNLLFALHFQPGQTPQSLLVAHGLWRQRHADGLKVHRRPHDNDCDPNRRLRIGYVSPDFCAHVVSRFLLPLFTSINRAEFEIICYSNTAAPDVITARFQAAADLWRPIRGMPDAQAADLIRSDRIDILVDLSMHAADNRLLLFARKPAPVQTTWLAYPGTTGLDTIDYRLTDPYLDPPGNDACYSEVSIRLPETYWCYHQTVITPDANAPPALAAGNITFGCLNNFGKVSHPALRCWAALLHSLPAARLILHAKEGTHRQRTLDFFAGENVDPARCTFVPSGTIAEYFHHYHNIDIALDPFPYGGGTTTCDALWMGVPVITLRGETAVGRGGVSILSNVGLPELIAQTPEQYIQIAAGLAGDLPRLAHLRTTLRQRMQASPLMDAPRFARSMEAAYRQMWQTWCISR